MVNTQIQPRKLSAPEIAKRIRDKVADLNDDLLLAKLAEMDVEIQVLDFEEAAVSLVAWCRQEV